MTETYLKRNGGGVGCLNHRLVIRLNDRLNHVGLIGQQLDY